MSNVETYVPVHRILTVDRRYRFQDAELGIGKAFFPFPKGVLLELHIF